MLAQMDAKNAGKSRFVFGPVLSGRLGRSLGLDLLGARVCSFDCLYCEAGRTDNRTLERAVYADPDQILAELAAHKARDPSPVDAVTLGGLGEPCLNSAIETVISGAKRIYPDVPVALLTNSSLLWLPEVRREVLGADIILPSLDSLVEAEYVRLNRPCPGIALRRVADGLRALRDEFSGRIFLEVLLADGINDSAENLEALRDFTNSSRPDRIDVVSLSRPGAYPGVQAAKPAVLTRFRGVLAAPAPAAPLAGHGPSGLVAAADASALAALVTASLARRPQTAAQLAAALGRPEDEMLGILRLLEARGEIAARRELGATFFSPAGV